MPDQLAPYLLLALSGAIWGLREKLHQRPKFFETVFGVSPMSFWGSFQWKRKYVDYDGGDRRYRNWLIGIFPYNDFWHSSWYVVKSILVLCCLSMDRGNGWEGVAISFLAVFATTILSAGGTFLLADRLEEKSQAKA